MSGDDCDVNYAQQTTGGLAGAPKAIDYEQVQRDQRIQSAIWILTEARRIRNDSVLIADIRSWVAEQRNEFMLLLDDLGG